LLFHAKKSEWSGLSSSGETARLPGLDETASKSDVIAMPGETPRKLTSAARRALAEAAERRAVEEAAKAGPKEVGRKGPDPVRYGDWEKKGIASDF
jgi:hypothetical protein